MMRMSHAHGAPWLAVLLALTVWAGPARAQDDPRLAAVAPQIESLLARHGLPGAVLVINQHGRPVYARAGHATLDFTLDGVRGQRPLERFPF